MSDTPNDLRSRLDVDGFAMLESVLGDDDIKPLLDDLAEAHKNRFARTRRGSAFAIRNLLAVSPKTREIASSEPLAEIAREALGGEARPVWGLFFDKIPAANWTVPWHQDVTITVAKPVDMPGFGPWTEKLGVPHVQAPLSILRRMVTLRLHLDDCGDDDGALWVVPGSHRHGKLAEEEIRRLGREVPLHVCTARAGDVLVMSPLILHSSSPAKEPSHRRVVHLEYAACELPDGLEWYEDSSPPTTPS